MTSRVITALPAVVAEHIAAVNAFDTERIVATFTPDAYVNDDRHEIWGVEAIRKFMAKEFVGDHVTMEVREVIDTTATSSSGPSTTATTTRPTCQTS
jgi:ketosteroid isomerase-like protein